jgi:hypothetical protein
MLVREVIEWYEQHPVREYNPVALKERKRLWKLFSNVHGGYPVESRKPTDLLRFIEGRHARG